MNPKSNGPFMQGGFKLWLIKYLFTFAVFIFGAASVYAQDNTRLAIFTVNSYTIQTRVPATWIRASTTDETTLDIRSAPNLPIEIVEWQRIELQVLPLVATYGNLPPDNRLGTYLELFAASLPIISEYPPESFSEIAEFTWGDYHAATFKSYSPRYYAWWVAIELDTNTVLLIQLGTTLPDSNPPTAETLSIFEMALQNLSVNEEVLPFEPMQAALDRLTDPLEALAPATASLRLRDGLEVRVAAPEGWFRRDVTESANYPSIYLLEDDVRNFVEGQDVQGAVIQITLMSETHLLRLFNTDSLPSDLAVAYLNTFLPLADANFQPDDPIEFDWGYPSLLLPASYGTNLRQHLILVETDNALVLLTIYAPQTRWTQLRPIWQNILSSLTINGVTLPNEPLLGVYEQITAEGK